MFFLGDILVHTWDVARAAGLDETLDQDEVTAMLAGHGADGRGAAGERALRAAGRGAGRRRRADEAHRLHRPAAVSLRTLR